MKKKVKTKINKNKEVMPTITTIMTKITTNNNQNSNK